MSESPATDEELTGEPHGTPPGEHDSELPDEKDGRRTGDHQEDDLQEENAGTSQDQPSQ